MSDLALEQLWEVSVWCCSLKAGQATGWRLMHQSCVGVRLDQGISTTSLSSSSMWRSRHCCKSDGAVSWEHQCLLCRSRIRGGSSAVLNIDNNWVLTALCPYQCRQGLTQWLRYEKACAVPSPGMSLGKLVHLFNPLKQTRLVKESQGKVGFIFKRWICQKHLPKTEMSEVFLFFCVWYRCPLRCSWNVYQMCLDCWFSPIFLHLVP